MKNCSVVVQIAIMVLFVMCSGPGALAQTAVAPAGDGLTTGTAYQIKELGNLVWLHDIATTTTATAGRYFKLVNSIDASATAGWSGGFNPIPVFAGNFIGNGYAISGLVINRSGTDKVGLFGFVTAGQISGLGLVGGSVIGLQNVGCLAGLVDHSNITNCYATGSVSGGAYLGGLIGYQKYGVTSRCHATGNVTGWYEGGQRGKVGGLIGANDYGTVVMCYATGNVDAPGGAGGLIGTITSCQISQCRANGSVTSTFDYAGSMGGLVGYAMTSTITECCASGGVSGTNCIGGLIGSTIYGITVTRCYATGAVNGYNYPFYVGGVIGKIEQGGTVDQCYAACVITSGNPWDGVAVGGGTGTSITNCYYDSDLARRTSYMPNGTAKTTAEMKQQTTYGGWDFNAVWGIQGGYPYLKKVDTSVRTYRVSGHGKVGNGITTSTLVTETLNAGFVGNVKAVPDAGYSYSKWSDDQPFPNRTDTAQGNLDVTAIFVARNAANNWRIYR